jgi:uncharacterized membrane protein
MGAKGTGTLSQAKTLGGIGSILVLLAIIPYVGTVLAVIGFVMTLIAMKYISDSLQDGSIFKDIIIAVALSIVGFVVVGAIVAVNVYRFIGFGSHVTSTTIASRPGFGSFVGDIIGGLLVGWIVLIVSAYFFRKAYNTAGQKLNVGIFKTAALVYFIGAILTIIVVGLLLILIAQVLLIVAFFSIPDTLTPYAPGMPPPSPSGYPTTTTGVPSASSAGGRFCVKCGASLAQDAMFCPSCGASQPAIT